MLLDLVREAVEEKFQSALVPLIELPEILPCRYRQDANLIGAVYNYLEVAEHSQAD